MSGELGPSVDDSSNGALNTSQLEQVQAFISPLVVEGRERSAEEVATTDQAVSEMKTMFKDKSGLDLSDPQTFFDAYATLHAYVTYRQAFIDEGLSEEQALAAFQRVLANAAPEAVRQPR